MFGSCLQELLQSGNPVEIDGISKFQKLPLFPDGINHQNKIALARISKKSMLHFEASNALLSEL